MEHTNTRPAFTDLFPPPKFLQMKSAGLDISDRRIRFLDFKKGRHGLVVGRSGEMQIPEGIIVSGELKKPEEFRKVLRSFHEKYGIEFAHVSLPEERAYMIKMETPDISGDELRDSIAFQLEDYVPIPASEAIFDYSVIKKTEQRKGYVDVAVSVISQNELKRYVDMFTDTGIMPVSFEIEAQAIARAVLSKGDKGTYMIIDFGDTRMGISIVSSAAVRFTSTINIGSDTITAAIQKHFSINHEEAYRMKNEKKISKSAGDKKFFQAVLSTISIIRDEINKLYIYWHTHGMKERGGEKIEKIIMCGGGTNLAGLPDYLSASLKIKVEVANPWRNVNSFENYIPEIPSNEALGYASVIGLALRSVGDTTDDTDI